METFRERRASNDGSYFLLIYDGTPIELSDDEHSEVDRRLRLFMDNKDIHSDVIKNVSCIRTIFVDYDEVYLYMKYHDKTKDEFVEYKNKELTIYECNINEKEKKKKGNKNTQNNYAKKQEIINQLKTIGPVGIGPNEYKIIDAYNYFFNMHPNFGNQNTNILFQCMIQILKRFDIDIIELDDFVYDEKLGISISKTLEKMVTDLFPYGTIRGLGNDKEVEDNKEKISIIGNIIIDNIHFADRVQGLINVTKLLCPTQKEIDDINQINDMNNNFHNLELVKKIKSEINS